MKIAFGMAAKAGLLASAFAISGGAAAAPYSDIYVFGDSLVDAGNIQQLFGIPDPAEGYYNGRFTNGPDFTDLLAQQITGSYTSPSLTGGNNFAYGGARIVDNGGPPDLDDQVSNYLGRSGGSAESDSLYVVNMAGNDVFALQSGDIGGRTQAEYISLAASTIVGNVERLDGAGAGSILLMGVPNTTPAGFALQNAIMAELTTASLTAELFQFNYFSFFDTILTNPAMLGLPPQDLSVNCIDVRPVVNGEIDCTGIFSFDGVHFSAEIHRPLFREVADLVGVEVDVPAPGALALFGIAALGLYGARKRLAARHES